ncbi:delta-60 repeat domain-containing protein [Roseiflexus sp.]
MNTLTHNLIALITMLSLATAVTLSPPSSAHTRPVDPLAVPLTGRGDFFVINPAMFTSPGKVNTFIPLSDGRVLVAGRFVAIGGQATPRSLAILKSDGAVDPTFQVDARLQVGEVYDAALQEDGKIVIAGWFKILPDLLTHFLLRLNPDGSLDEAFVNYDISSHVFAVLIDGNKIVIGGNFTQPTPRIARLSLDGTADSTFSGVGSGADGAVRDIARQSNGKYIIVGEFSSFNGTSQVGVARLNANGSLDASFVPGGFRPSQRVAVLNDNSVVVGGEDRCGNNLFKWYAADGSPKPTPADPVNPNWFESITALLPLPDGGFLIGGWYSFLCINGSPTEHRGQVWRYAADGTYRTMTEFGNESDILGLALRSDGKVIVGGQGVPETSSQVGIFDGLALLDLANDGVEKVGAFRPLVGDEANIYSLSRYTDGRLLVAGNFSHVNGSPRFGLARLLASGGLDTDFHPFADKPGGYSYAALALPDGRAVAGFGWNNLYLIGENGSLTDLSAINNYDRVSALALQSDGKVLVGGSKVRRLKADFSGTDLDFTNGDVSGWVYALAVQGDKIYVAGDFSKYNTVDVAGLVRLNSDGSIDGGFNPPTFLTDVSDRGQLYSVTPLLNGNVLVGGSFHTAGGEARSGLVRLTNTGESDPGFTSPTTFRTVKSICVQGDGSIWAGGVESAFPREPLISHFNTNGQIADTSFPGFYQSAHHRDGTVDVVLCDTNEGLRWVGGRFSLINGQPFYGLARYVPLRGRVFLPLALRQ